MSALEELFEFTFKKMNPAAFALTRARGHKKTLQSLSTLARKPRKGYSSQQAWLGISKKEQIRQVRDMRNAAGMKVSKSMTDAPYPKVGKELQVTRADSGFGGNHPTRRIRKGFRGDETIARGRNRAKKSADIRARREAAVAKRNKAQGIPTPREQQIQQYIEGVIDRHKKPRHVPFFDLNDHGVNMSAMVDLFEFARGDQFLKHVAGIPRKGRAASMAKSMVSVPKRRSTYGLRGAKAKGLHKGRQQVWADKLKAQKRNPAPGNLERLTNWDWR